MQEVIHHLVCGWHGFVRILRQATDAKVKFTQDDMTRLEAMKVEFEEVLARQGRL